MKLSYYALVLFFFPLTIYGQHYPLFSQFPQPFGVDNLATLSYEELLNWYPGCRFFFVGRKQWIGFEGTPLTLGFSYEQKQKLFFWGVHIFRDEIGLLKTNEIGGKIGLGLGRKSNLRIGFGINYSETNIGKKTESIFGNIADDLLFNDFRLFRPRGLAANISLFYFKNIDDWTYFTGMAWRHFWIPSNFFEFAFLPHVNQVNVVMGCKYRQILLSTRLQSNFYTRFSLDFYLKSYLKDNFFIGSYFSLDDSIDLIGFQSGIDVNSVKPKFRSCTFSFGIGYPLSQYNRGNLVVDTSISFRFYKNKNSH